MSSSRSKDSCVSDSVLLSIEGHSSKLSQGNQIHDEPKLGDVSTKPSGETVKNKPSADWVQKTSGN